MKITQERIGYESFFLVSELSDAGLRSIFSQVFLAKDGSAVLKAFNSNIASLLIETHKTLISSATIPEGAKHQVLPGLMNMARSWMVCFQKTDIFFDKQGPKYDSFAVLLTQELYNYCQGITAGQDPEIEEKILKFAQKWIGFNKDAKEIYSVVGLYPSMQFQQRFASFKAQLSHIANFDELMCSFENLKKCLQTLLFQLKSIVPSVQFVCKDVDYYAIWKLFLHFHVKNSHAIVISDFGNLIMEKVKIACHLLSYKVLSLHGSAEGSPIEDLVMVMQG
jgi:hypothetical protein